MVSTDIGIWTAAILTLMTYSILYKEGPPYRFAEATAIGFGVGYTFCITLNSLRPMTVAYWFRGDFESLIPVALGVLLYTRFVPSLRWLQRPSLAVMTGLGMGLSIRGAMHAQFILQIAGMITTIPVDPVGAFTWIVGVLGTVTVMLYFIFAHLKTQKLEPPRVLGRYMLMIGLGAAFAGGTLTWITDVIVRIQFLLLEWLQI